MLILREREIFIHSRGAMCAHNTYIHTMRTSEGGAMKVRRDLYNLPVEQIDSYTSFKEYIYIYNTLPPQLVAL